MSNIGRPAGFVGSGGQVPYWDAFPGFPATYGWQFTSAPSSGQFLSWDGSACVWATPGGGLVGLTDSSTTYLGVSAYAGTSGTALGLYAYAGTQGTAVGMRAGNAGGGSYSVVVGYYAGYQNYGTYLTSIGHQSFYTSCSGSYNTGVGYRAGYGCSSAAAQNVFIGASSGSGAGYCLYNTLVGYNTQLAATNNAYAIVIGHAVTGKGTSTTVIGKTGTGATTETWLRGEILRVGNEGTATNKFILFQRNATANTTQPGFWFNDTGDNQLYWSHDGVTWNAFSTGGGLVGITNTSGGAPAYPERLTALGYTAADSFSLVYQAWTGYVTAIGYGAATAHTTDGYMGTFVGYNAGGGQTAGRYGTFVGAYAGYAGTGINNTAVGYNSLYGAGGSTMANCSALGFSAGWAHALGDNCTYIGSYAGYANYNAVNNVMVGANAGRYITDYSNNVIVGASAAAGGSYKIQQCVIIGSGAGANMTKLTQVYADHVLIGYNAGLGLGINSNSESGIIAIGTSTGYGYNDSGGVYIGDSAGAGFGAGGAAVVGGYNGAREIYIGFQAGYYGQGGSVNIGIGALALFGKDTGGTGVGNVAIGSSAGKDVTDGSYNAFYGTECGLTPTTGELNVCIGYTSDTSAVDSANVIAIGDHCKGPTNSIAIGDTVVLTNSNSGMISPTAPVSSAVPASYFWIGDSAANITVQAGAFTAHSDVRIKKNIEDLSYGLDFVLGLRPRLYDLKTPSTGASKRKHMGFIAQELKEDTQKKGLEASLVADDDPDSWAVDYNQLVAPLVKAVQELSAQVDGLKKALAELKAKG